MEEIYRDASIIIYKTVMADLSIRIFVNRVCVEGEWRPGGYVKGYNFLELPVKR